MLKTDDYCMTYRYTIDRWDGVKAIFSRPAFYRYMALVHRGAIARDREPGDTTWSNHPIVSTVVGKGKDFHDLLNAPRVIIFWTYLLIDPLEVLMVNIHEDFKLKRQECFKLVL